MVAAVDLSCAILRDDAEVASAVALKLCRGGQKRRRLNRKAEHRDDRIPLTSRWLGFNALYCSLDTLTLQNPLNLNIFLHLNDWIWPALR
jgi:hypothetical protein